MMAKRKGFNDILEILCPNGVSSEDSNSRNTSSPLVDDDLTSLNSDNSAASQQSMLSGVSRMSCAIFYWFYEFNRIFIIVFSGAWSPIKWTIMDSTREQLLNHCIWFGLKPLLAMSNGEYHTLILLSLLIKNVETDANRAVQLRIDWFDEFSVCINAYEPRTDHRCAFSTQLSHGFSS